MHNPLEQFEISHIVPMNIGGLDVSITNSALFMVLVVLVSSAFLILGMRRGSLVPGRWQSMSELTYEFIASMLTDNVGTEARKYFPFVFSVFIFVLVANLLGMVPYAFTVTSHIIVTFTLAMIVFLLVTLVGFIRNGAHFLKLFVPSDVPWYILPLLVVIEVVSYLTRPISLSVRLFANMMAGHTMLKLFGGFVVMLGALAGWAPWLFIVALSAMEVGIAMLQAYVFTILTCIYLNDAFHPSH
jgi:F-type H+-transporting ATPase subunit a